MARTGRPSSYTPEIGSEFLERLVESDFGIEHICEDGDMPSARTIFRWLHDHEDFRQQYARAKVEQGRVQAYRALKEALTAEDASLGRLRWDARRWAASKLAPKEYGDKLAVGQAEDLGPLTVVINKPE